MEGDPARPIVSRSDEAVIMDIHRVEITAVERRTLLGLAAVGLATATIGAAPAGDRFWAAWLLVAYYALGVGLSGLCFVAIHYTTGASWSVAIRRIAEGLAATIPLAVILLAILF